MLSLCILRNGNSTGPRSQCTVLQQYYSCRYPNATNEMHHDLGCAPHSGILVEGVCISTGDWNVHFYETLLRDYSVTPTRNNDHPALGATKHLHTYRSEPFNCSRRISLRRKSLELEKLGRVIAYYRHIIASYRELSQVRRESSRVIASYRELSRELSRVIARYYELSRVIASYRELSRHDNTVQTRPSFSSSRDPEGRVRTRLRPRLQHEAGAAARSGVAPETSVRR